MFVNREEEKKELSKILNSTSFEFAILYGRRRIGKTKLVLEMIKNQNHIYYLAVEKNNLSNFITVVAMRFPDILKLKEDWETILDFLKDRIHVLAIDEFQNLIKEDKSILSIFQRSIDTNLQNSTLKLFLLGSSISIISSEVLQYKGPLYGRKTFSRKIQPINFFDIGGFYSKIKFEDLAQIYGFADGIPFYLEKIQPPFWNWLENELMHPSFLKDEMDFILKYEFEDLGTYKIILEAIANGKTTVGEIKNYCKMQRTDISPYLTKLINTGFIYREVPMTESQISKMGRYYIKDQFVAFWFMYIYPNLSNIEEGIYHTRSIKINYSFYMGFVFEKICKQFISKAIKDGTFDYDKIGKWWYKDNEIDIVVMDDTQKKILFAECKWQDNVHAMDILRTLREKAALVQWHVKTRKEHYAIFAKSFRDKGNLGNNVFLFDSTDLEKILHQR